VTRSNAFSLTRLTPQRYAAGMRTYLLPLALVALLALVGPSCAEFDSGGIGPAKAKATQSTGARFDSGIAATRRAHKVENLDNGLACVRFALAARVRLFTVPAPAPQPIIKNPSNIQIAASAAAAA
jgi:hypothetical protein